MQNHSITAGGLFFVIAILLVLPATAAQESCSLYVASIPQGGTIFIDGNSAGITPAADIAVPCGIHSVSVQMRGYANYTSPASLDEGTHQDIIANLQRLPDRGLVTIRSEPAGGELFVDGTSRGVTPCVVDDLVPGRHEILIQKTGYEDYNDAVSIATDTSLEYTEYLIPLPGSGFLAVTSTPEGAGVRIDGSEAGLTPTNLQRIGAGNHTVEIYRNGYRNFTGMVNVAGGESMMAGADLTPDPTTCTLYIDSSPGGQGIYLNDTFKGSTPVTLETIPSGDYQVRISRQQNGASVNRSFRFMPGSTHEIFADLTNDTGGTVTDREWEYQDNKGMSARPGWMSLNVTPVIEKTYTWYANDHEATVTLDIPQDLYDYYRDQPHPRNETTSTFSRYAISAKDRQYLHNLVEKLKDASDFKSYNARNDYRNVIAFVQNIQYKHDIDPVTKLETDYWQYPVETLALGTGDCEDTAILTAALLKEMGYDVAIVILPGHAATAVACDNCNGYYYPLKGKRYYFLETTGTGFPLGSMSDEYQTAEATVIPL